MFTWMFGSGRGGAIAACVGGGALLVMGSFLLLNPELAQEMREARGRVVGVILLAFPVIAALQLVEAARHGRIRVGMEKFPRSRNPVLFRWFFMGHALIGLGFGSIGLALLR